MSINLSYYRRQIKKLTAKSKAHSELGEKEEAAKLEKEIANYENFIRQKEHKGVDKYLKGDL